MAYLRGGTSTSEAIVKLTQAQAECAALAVTDAELAAVAAVGYSHKEAARALMACRTFMSDHCMYSCPLTIRCVGYATGQGVTKDRVQRAVLWASAARQRRVQRELAEAQRREQERQQRKLGRTASGQRINMERLQGLCNLV